MAACLAFLCFIDLEVLQICWGLKKKKKKKNSQASQAVGILELVQMICLSSLPKGFGGHEIKLVVFRF